MTTEQTQHARDSAELRRLCSEREKVAEQAREIERLQIMSDNYCALLMDANQELADLKAQPNGVVQWPDADEIMQMAFEEGQPSEDASGYHFELEEFDLFIQRLMEEVARLNSSPVSAGDEQTGWTEKKPTKEGAYWIRGNGLEADALVQVKQEGELWCNLHMRNSEPDFDYGYTIEQLSSEFEWLGPLQVRVAPSVGSQRGDE